MRYHWKEWLIALTIFALLLAACAPASDPPSDPINAQAGSPEITLIAKEEIGATHTIYLIQIGTRRCVVANKFVKRAGISIDCWLHTQ